MTQSGPGQDRLTSKAGEESLPALKGSFHFRLGTTSYILPGEILPNARFLGPYVDEIELVLFESGHENSLPATGEIFEAARLALDLDLTYNVHLPVDLFLGEPDPALRRRFCQTAFSFYERTLPLDPTCYILHIDSRKADLTEEPDRSAWGDRVMESLHEMQVMGMDMRRVAAENLEYPLQRIYPFVDTFGMSFCLDVGHLLRYGHDTAEQASKFLEMCSMVHLHGVCNGRDHLGLQHIAPGEWELIRGQLDGYRGGISIEVFSLRDLFFSLKRMAELAERKKVNGA